MPVIQITRSNSTSPPPDLWELIEFLTSVDYPHTKEEEEPNPETVKVTEEMIAEQIEGTYFFSAHEGLVGAITQNYPEPYVSLSIPGLVTHPSLNRLTLCVLVLKNGFTVVGKSACVDPAAFEAL